MSWKNIQDHYRIGHIVQIREGKICIGSPYISDLIRVSFEGKVTWGELGESSNDDLARYYSEMIADLKKLRELIEAPDTFEKSLPVFTYQGGEILQKECEEYGWPNITHDGQIQYENTFHPDKAVVVFWAKRNAKLGIKSGKERLAEAEKRVEECRQFLADEEATLAKLEADYPSAEPPQQDEVKENHG